MMGVSVELFMKMDTLVSYEELRTRGDLTLLGPDHVVHFISHQWLGNEHPDPEGLQLRRMQRVFAEILTGGVESLFSEEDLSVFLGGVSKGTGPELQDIGAAGFGGQLAATEVAWKGYVWIDFCSVPQGASASLERELAVGSIPGYVERCDYFWILAPSATHANTGTQCDFATWRSRGWCRLEEWASCLSIRQKTQLVITDSPKISLVGHLDFVMSLLGRPEKAPCMGQFSCCRLNHLVEMKEGGTMQIPCDKIRVGNVLKQLCDAKLNFFRSSGQRSMYAVLTTLEQTLYRGSAWHVRPPCPGESLDAFMQKVAFAELEDRNEIGGTALHVAMMVGHLEVVRKILAARPELLGVRTKTGFSALMAGIYNYSLDFGAVLADDALGFGSALELDAATCNGISVLDRAAKGGFATHTGLLLERGANPESRRKDNGRTPIMSSAETGYVSCCAALLRHRADVNATDNDGNTCLHLAANPLTLIGDADPCAKLAVTKLLLAAKVDHTKVNSFGKTAFQVAEEGGFVSCASLLRTHASRRVAPDWHAAVPAIGTKVSL